jgi:hypothetical protein
MAKGTLKLEIDYLGSSMWSPSITMTLIKGRPIRVREGDGIWESDVRKKYFEGAMLLCLKMKEEATGQEMLTATKI